MSTSRVAKPRKPAPTTTATAPPTFGRAWIEAEVTRIFNEAAALSPSDQLQARRTALEVVPAVLRAMPKPLRLRAVRHMRSTFAAIERAFVRSLRAK